MGDVFTSEVTTGHDGLTKVAITDLTSSHPILYLSERSADRQEVWLKSGNCAVSLTKEQAYEALPFLLNFLDTGRLATR